MSYFVRFAVLGFLSMLAGVGGASAATVHARVVDEAGAPFARMRTELIDLVANRVIARTETGRDGIATYDDLLHGQYRVSIERSEDTVVHPEDNPLVRPADFSIVDPRATIEVQLEVHRGIPLHMRFVVDGSVLRHAATVHFEERESGRLFERPMSQGDNVFKLFPGRWLIRLTATDGLLLNKVDVDGRDVAGSILEFNLRAEDQARFVTWEFGAVARVTGRVIFERNVFPVQIAARLLEAGTWRESAHARGMDEALASVVTDVSTTTGSYVLELPDGRWKVEPIGDSLAAADPASETVELRPGDEARVSFVAHATNRKPRKLEVTVESSEGDPLADAVVELWPLDDDERSALEAPLRSGVTADGGVAELTDVGPGSYLVAAAHPDHPEGTVQLSGFEPGGEDHATPVVTLSRGGRIEVTLVDPDGLATGATWVVANSQDAAPFYVKAESIASATALPRSLIDQTGRAILRGLYPGTYEVAVLSPTAFFRFYDGDVGVAPIDPVDFITPMDEGDRDDGISPLDGVNPAGGIDGVGDERWVERLELHLHTNEVRQLEARVVPAGLVTGRLYCRDGAPIPSRVDLRVVPNKWQPEDLLDLRWQEEVALSLDRMPLSGATGHTHDRFDAGPLMAASYIVAVRPAGFDRWTWAFGTEDGAEAGSFEVREGTQVDLGDIGVDCGPAIRIEPEVESGATAPDLRDLRLQSEHVEVTGHVRTIDGEMVETRRIAAEAHEKLILLRGFVEGEAALHVRLGHRYFLPQFWIDVPIAAALERGGTLRIPLPVEDVGGAIAVHALGAAAVRLVRDDEPLRVPEFDGDRVTLNNVPAGTYRVDLCKDAGCDAMLHTWPDVAVAALATTRLAFGFPEPESESPGGVNHSKPSSRPSPH